MKLKFYCSFKQIALFPVIAIDLQTKRIFLHFIFWGYYIQYKLYENTNEEMP